MIILYLLLIAYIIAVNFYAFLQIKSYKDVEKQLESERQTAPFTSQDNALGENTSNAANAQKTPDKAARKLLITGLLGGAITIYACMFIFKYKRTELLLMILMPLLSVLNIYLWVLLFRSGFSFFVLR